MVEPSFLHPGAFTQPMRKVRVGETIKSAPDNGPKTFEIAFKFVYFTDRETAINLGTA